MPDLSPRLAAALLPLALAACSSAPAPAPLKPDEPQRVVLLCHPGARAAQFDKIGVPGGERPAQVELGGEGQVWVRFESERLLRLTPAGKTVDVEMRLPQPGERWTAMDVDPEDGSIWLSSNRLELVRITPAGAVSRTPLQGVTGASGFRALRVDGDSVWAVPFCAGYRLLRFERTGGLRARTFRIEPRPAVAAEEIPVVSRLECGGVLLERDAAGRLLAFHPEDRLTYELDAQGEWVASENPLFAAFPSSGTSLVQGVGIGSAEEQWYVGRDATGVFLWKGRSVFLGPEAAGRRLSRVFMVPTAAGTRELVESCYGNLILDVATDATRYAAITERTVVFGDVASAPELPF